MKLSSNLRVHLRQPIRKRHLYIPTSRYGTPKFLSNSWRPSKDIISGLGDLVSIKLSHSIARNANTSITMLANERSKNLRRPFTGSGALGSFKSFIEVVQGDLVLFELEFVDLGVEAARGLTT